MQISQEMIERLLGMHVLRIAILEAELAETKGQLIKAQIQLKQSPDVHTQNGSGAGEIDFPGAAA